MGLAAKLYRDDRVAERMSVELEATLRDPDLQPIDVEVSDLSVTGFRARCPADLPLGAEISLGLAGIGVQRATVVRRNGDFYGCEFGEQLRPGDIERALDAETVVRAPFVAMPSPGTAPELEAAPVEPLPMAARVAVILGLSGMLWGMIGLGARALLG